MKKTIFTLLIFMGLLPSLAMAQKSDDVYFIPSEAEKMAINAARDSVNQKLYDQALAALENQCFIIRFETWEGSTGRSLYDSRSTFLELDGEKIAYQKPGWGHHGMVKHVGKASSICMKKDESGNILYSMVLDIPNVFRGTHVKIVLDPTANKCKVYYRRKYARKTNGYDTGIVYPLGTTTVLKGQEPLLR